jgi:hypothetical protein
MRSAEVVVQMFMARVRVVLVRHPLLYWALVAAPLSMVAVSVESARSSAIDARDAWGATRQVWVSTSPRDIGEVVRAERRTVPEAMVPDDAVELDPNGRVARRPATRGEVITDRDVAPSPLALSVPPGHVALPIGQSPMPDAEVGDGATLVLPDGSVDGVVVAIDDEAVTVAVAMDEVPRVAAALWGATVVVGISG